MDALNPAVNSFLAEPHGGLRPLAGDSVAGGQMALQELENLRQQQAASFAYFDSFVVFAAISASLVLLVFLMKRSVAPKGAIAAAD